MLLLSLFFFVCPKMTLRDLWGVKVQDLSGKLTNFSPVSRHLVWLFYPTAFREVLIEPFVFVLLVFCFVVVFVVVVVVVNYVVRLFAFSALIWTLFISLLFCHVHLLKLSSVKKNQPYSPSMRRLCLVSLSTYFSSTLFDHGQNSTQPHFTRSISQLRLSH